MVATITEEQRTDRRLGDVFQRGEGTLAERRARNLRSEVLGLATAKLRRRLEAAIEDDPGVVELLDRVVSRELDPATAAAELLKGEIDE